MTTPSVTMLIVIGKYSLTCLTSSSLDGFSLLILRLAICVYISAYVAHAFSNAVTLASKVSIFVIASCKLLTSNGTNLLSSID